MKRLDLQDERPCDPRQLNIVVIASGLLPREPTAIYLGNWALGKGKHLNILKTGGHRQLT